MGGGALLALLSIGGVGATIARTPHQHPMIEGPASWQPFAADIVKRTPGHAEHEVFGKFFRSADGSTRTEWFGPKGTPMAGYRLVTIHNYTQLKKYVQGADGAWSSLAMKPGTTLKLHREMTAHPGRLFAETSAEGMVAYRMETGPHNFAVRVPELNFFKIAVETPGLTMRYFNVKRGEQDRALFEPDAQATIRRATDDRDLARPSPGPPPWEATTK